jgi:phospholipid/cholesterol/gamma-HCH transport system permease protein
MNQWLRAVGRTSLDVYRDTLSVWALFIRVCLRFRVTEPRLILRQAYEAGNQSLPFVLLTLGFTGAIMVVEACVQGQKILGDLSMIGPAFMKLLVREFAPTISALMLAARYGAGTAAEIGTMKISEQVDALRLAGADALTYLACPRILGGTIAGVGLGICGAWIGFTCGGLVAHGLFDIGIMTYFDYGQVGLNDVLLGVIKCACFGFAVPLMAVFAGLGASGGAPGVGRATTYAVIGGSVAVLALDFFLGLLGFWLLP